MYLGLLSILFFSLRLFAYSDADFDGVEDSIDRCPNTLLTELVDISGCTIKELESPHHFDVVMGMSYSQISPVTQEKTDTISSALQADYYYKKFSIQLSTAYFNSQSDITTSSGMTDTFLGVYYQFEPFSDFNLRLGGGLLLPTYDADNNNIDYTASASLSYLFKSFNFFGSYGYTMINDDDIFDIAYYQNSSAFNTGVGFYPTSRLYTSVSYNQSDSIYSKVITKELTLQRIEPLKTASFYLFYTLDKNWFTTLNYAYGLSDSASDHYLNLRLGYYF